MAAYARKQFNGAAIPTTLTATIGASDTSLAITTNTGWPDGGVGNFEIVINRGGATEEKILCSSRTGSTLAVASSGRGYDGTTAAIHNAGEPVEHCLTASDLDEANQAVVATLGTVSAKGDLLVATAANTIARLAAGSTGQALTVDGSQTTGLKYATVGSVTNVSSPDGNITITNATTTPSVHLTGISGIGTNIAESMTLNVGGSATSYVGGSGQVTCISKNSTGQIGGQITRMLTILFTGAVASGAWTVTGLSTSALYQVNTACWTGYLTTTGTVRSCLMVVASGTGTIYVSNASGVYVAMNNATFAVANNDVLALSVCQ